MGGRSPPNSRGGPGAQPPENFEGSKIITVFVVRFRDVKERSPSRFTETRQKKKVSSPKSRQWKSSSSAKCVPVLGLQIMGPLISQRLQLRVLLRTRGAAPQSQRWRRRSRKCVATRPLLALLEDARQQSTGRTATSGTRRLVSLQATRCLWMAFASEHWQRVL